VATGKLIHRQPVHDGRIVHVSVDRVRLPNGHEVALDMVWHPGAAAVVPFVNGREILLVRQYRWATGGWIYEVPAGKLQGPDDTPAACAARELEEEVGRRAGRLEELGFIWTAPGFSDEKIHLFLATDLETVPQSLEDDEVLEVVQMPFLEALDMASRGQIPDAKSQCALLQVHLRLEPEAFRPPE
jgi:ADP-ribose pyrophosphatase